MFLQLWLLLLRTFSLCFFIASLSLSAFPSFRSSSTCFCASLAIVLASTFITFCLFLRHHLTEATVCFSLSQLPLLRAWQAGRPSQPSLDAFLNPPDLLRSVPSNRILVHVPLASKFVSVFPTPRVVVLSLYNCEPEAWRSQNEPRYRLPVFEYGPNAISVRRIILFVLTGRVVACRVTSECGP